MSPAHPSYWDFISYRSIQIPSVKCLVDYVQKASKSECHDGSIIALDYDSTFPATTNAKPIKEVDLSSFLADPNRPQGRILVVQDVNHSLINVLGALLDVDPLFFAGHVGTEFPNLENAPPGPAYSLTPVRIAEAGFLHLHYQQVLTMTETTTDGGLQTVQSAPYSVVTAGNIPRNIRRLPSLSGKQLCLARGCLSLVVKQPPGSSWTCLVLVDPPIKSAKSKTGVIIPYTFEPLHASYESFQPPQLFSSFQASGVRSNYSQDTKQSILERLVHYYTTSPPANDVLSLAYFPTRMVMSEWQLYTKLASRFLKHYEYNLQDLSRRLHNDDIVDLQRWRRRCQQSKHKLSIVAEFIDYHTGDTVSAQDKRSPWRLILKDIDHVQSELQDFGQSLEQMIPVATSMVQILDARYSVVHAANSTRLAYVALIFVPLSWVASLFSMSEGYGPGGKLFWMYFAIALPLVLLTLMRPKSAFLPDPADVDTSGWIRATSGYAGLIALSRTNSESTHVSGRRTPARMLQHVSSRPALQRRPHTSGEHIRSDNASPEIEICPSVAMLDFATYAESIRGSRQPPRQSALGTVDANGVSRPPVCDWGDWMNENSGRTHQRHSSPAQHGKATPGSGSKLKKFWRRLSSSGRSPAPEAGSPVQSNKRRATSAHYRGTPHPRDRSNQRQPANTAQLPIRPSDPFPEVKDPTFYPSERQPRRLVKKCRPASSPAPAPRTLHKPPLQEAAVVTRCYAGPSGVPSLPLALPSHLPPPSMAELPGSHRMPGSGHVLGAKTSTPARPEPGTRMELPDDFYPLDKIGRELAAARYKLNMCCDCGSSPPRQGQPTCDWCGETRRRMLVAAPSHTSSMSVFRPSSVYGTMSPYDHDDDDITTIHTQTASEVVDERRASRAPAQLKPLEPVKTGYEEMGYPQKYQSQFQQYKQLYEDKGQDKQPYQKQAPKTPPPKPRRKQYPTPRYPSEVPPQPKEQYPNQAQHQPNQQYPSELQSQPQQQYESQPPPPAPLAPPASLVPAASLGPPAALLPPGPPPQQQQQQHRQQYPTQLQSQPNQQYQSQLQPQPTQQYESQPPPAVPAAPPPQQQRQQYSGQAHSQMRQPYPSQIQLKQQYQQTQLQYAQEYQNRHEQQLQQQMQQQLEQRLQQHLQSQNTYNQEYQVTYCPQCRGPKESPRLHLCDHCYAASLHQWAAQRRW
ncbi:hypothetical protein ACKVWM_007266 [Pyricularia oryzae]